MNNLPLNLYYFRSNKTNDHVIIVANTSIEALGIFKDNITPSQFNSIDVRIYIGTNYDSQVRILINTFDKEQTYKS